jgi:hypothetical protein
MTYAQLDAPTRAEDAQDGEEALRWYLGNRGSRVEDEPITSALGRLIADLHHLTDAVAFGDFNMILVEANACYRADVAGKPAGNYALPGDWMADPALAEEA